MIKYSLRDFFQKILPTQTFNSSVSQLLTFIRCRRSYDNVVLMFPDESCTITPWTCFMSSTLAWGWCVLALCWSLRWVFRRAFGVLELICHAAGSVWWVRSRDRPVIGFWSSGHGHWKHLTAPLFLSLSLLGGVIGNENYCPIVSCVRRASASPAF